MTTAQALAALTAQVADLRAEVASARTTPKASSVAAVVQPKAEFPIPKVLSCTASKKPCEFIARTADGAAHHLSAKDAPGTKGHREYRKGIRILAE